MENYKNQPVIKSNKLIEAKYKLTLNEIRLIYVIIAEIKPEDEEFKRHLLKVKDLLKIFGITTNDYHFIIKRILENLSRKSITIEDRNEKNRFFIANWFASAEYIGKDGIIEIELSPKLKPYLLQLKTHFTIFELDKILKLKSVYSIRLYELLYKEYCYYGKYKTQFIFSIVTIKELLGIDKTQYLKFNNFKRKVLDIAKRELKSKSEFYFEYKTIKTGRAVTDIEFIVFNKAKENINKNNLIFNKQLQLQDIPSSDEIEERLKAFEYHAFKKIRTLHSDEVLLDALKDLDFEIERRKKTGDTIENLAGWFNARLPESGEPYQFSSSYQKHIKEEIKKEQARIKRELEEAQRIEQMKRQEEERRLLQQRIEQKINELKDNYQYAAVESEAVEKAASKLSPPNQRTELKRLTESFIKDLSKKEFKELENEAVSITIEKLKELNIDETHTAFQSVLKTSSQNMLSEIAQNKYSKELEYLLKQTPAYISYKEKLNKQIELEIKHIVHKRYLS